MRYSSGTMEDVTTDLLLVSVFSVCAFVVLIATIIGCACCAKTKKSKNGDAANVEKGEADDAKKSKEKPSPKKEEAASKPEANAAKSTKPAEPSKKEETAPKGGDAGKAKESLDPPQFELPAFTIVSAKDASMADTVVDMRGRQEFKATLYMKTDDAGKAALAKSKRQVSIMGPQQKAEQKMQSAKSLFGVSMLTARDLPTRKEAAKTQRVSEPPKQPTIIAEPSKKRGPATEKSTLQPQPGTVKDEVKNGAPTVKVATPEAKSVRPLPAAAMGKKAAAASLLV